MIAIDGTAQILSAESIFQGNSDTAPEAVKPVESAVRGKGGTLEHAFSPSSVTVLRLRKG